MKKVSTSRLTIMILLSMLVGVISQAQQNGYEETNVSSGFALSNWYACSYGDYEPACVAIGEDAPSESIVANVNSNALSNWYACNYGDYQPACDAINKPLNTNILT